MWQARLRAPNPSTSLPNPSTPSPYGRRVFELMSPSLQGEVAMVALQRIVSSVYYFRDATASVARGALTATLVASDNTAAGPAALAEDDMMLIAPTEFVPFKGQPPMHITSADPICKWRVDHPDGTTFTHFTLVPVLVCTAPKKTVGLGDNISGAALAYSI